MGGGKAESSHVSIEEIFVQCPTQLLACPSWTRSRERFRHVQLHNVFQNKDPISFSQVISTTAIEQAEVRIPPRKYLESYVGKGMSEQDEMERELTTRKPAPNKLHGLILDGPSRCTERG
jgi:hypothetical protein